ncbi:MAG: potassium-transporting ATPase subunit KdpA [Parachlamydiaceae bacterium]|nr:potassium-transporting ATPase subunit KdpA [Parachlamydiaceae bacterium]
MITLDLILFCILLFLISPLLGRYLAFIFKDTQTHKILFLSAFEQKIYQFCQISPDSEMTWKEYLKNLLFLNFLGIITVFFLQEFQEWLPLNPQHLPAVEWSLALNTAISFVTNTNWQSYGGENTLSYLTQMAGLTVQNFLSAATGMSILLALIRGIIRQSSQFLGNFWVDLTKAILYILLPLSILISLFLVTQGTIQNFKPYVSIETLEQQHQLIPQGPVASQVAIKQLGTNGGGFFNANSSHPFENPSPLSNFITTFLILMIPASIPFMYGHLINSKKDGWIIFIVMFSLWMIGLIIAELSQSTFNSTLQLNPVLEGIETRLGLSNSLLWAVSTTGSSSGSVNSMLSSLSPLTGGIALFNIMLEELVFGGNGVGLCRMIMFVILTVFLAGLMVGRTPEYFGKKIEKKEIQWVMLAILIPSALVLIGASIAIILPKELQGIKNLGPHGLSEILYAFSSTAGNNGSSFAGLNSNTYFYNLGLGFVMLAARLTIIVSTLAIANHLASKKSVSSSIGTFSTNTFLFGMLLLNVIFIIGALTFFPSLALGPIVEHILMLRGESF